jgi:predicted  nucleic acid-binding Zn-ribbon protein
LLNKLNSESFSLNVDYVSIEKIREEFENEIEKIQNNFKELSSAVYYEMKKHPQEFKAIIENKISFLKAS